MESKSINDLVNNMAEAVLLVDADDPSGQAQLHELFQLLTEKLLDSKSDVVLECVSKQCMTLLEDLIMGDVDNSQDSIDSLADVVGVMQSVLNEEIEPDEAVFPDFISIENKNSESSCNQPAKSLLTINLPENVDEGILIDFLSRQPSELEKLEQLVMELENDSSSNAMDGIKRMIHTLKGETGLLGLTPICDLCHAIEDAIENRPISELIEAILTIKDWLVKIFGAYAGENEPPESVENMLALLASDRKVTEEKQAKNVPVQTVEADIVTEFSDPSLVAEFIAEAREHLDAAEVELLNVEEDPANEDTLNAIFRSFHTIKGVAGFIGLPDIQSLAHISETVLDHARKTTLILEGHALDVAFEAVDSMKHLIDLLQIALEAGGVPQADPELHVVVSKLEALANPNDASLQKAAATLDEEKKSAVSADAKLGEILQLQEGITSEKVQEAVAIQNKMHAEVPKLGEVLTEKLNVPKDSINKALKLQKEAKEKAAENTPSKSVQVAETVKVDASRLDRLVDAIGELVIAQAMLSQVAVKQCNGDASEVARNLNHLDKITRELQEMATSLRMVPVRSTFQKMARLARDVARKLGKQVNFVMEGEDTDLDKTVVDRIGDPLVHMVRNALDHGIEGNSEDRIAAGKSAVGLVTLRAYHKGGGICIEIQDDGHGLDKEVLLAKAIERGVVNEGDELTDQEIFHLIFAPGFSTAQQVTDVSGRGVGMDVVKRNIEALRGKIEIQSELGQGSTFTIRLPLTLAIIEGMVVRLSTERYIIPTLSIVRMLQPNEVDIKSMMQNGQALLIDDELIPLGRLDKIFDVHGAQQDPTEATLVIVENSERKMALLIDELIGQQQIVIKPLGATMRGLPGIAGGAVMSDGKVGLVIDISSLMGMCRSLEIGDTESAPMALAA